MENQNLEWKETWRDEYLKTICAFANAQGGRLEIGRDDRGRLVGLPEARKLLGELPNKIRTTMGLVADINLRREDEFEFLTIIVSAHSNAISYRGKYYYRSGSTTQELTGLALDELILRKYGRTWDSVPVPYVAAKEFYNDAFDIFRKKAAFSKRLAPEDMAGGNEELLKALKLTEGDYLLRAAPLLFHQDPEKYCFGSYIKIGYFESDADLLYQDEIGGPLIGLADRAIEVIYTKYFKGLIHYEGLQRVDDYPLPRDVLREALLNAVVHRDYSTGNPIHVKIYADRLIIYNCCRLPDNATSETLIGEGRSNPHNPLIAGAFFRSGQIEAWGRGIEKMKKGCRNDKLPEPEFKIAPTVFFISFRIRNNDKTVKIYSAKASEKSGIKSGINGATQEIRKKIMNFMNAKPDITALELAAELGLTRRNLEAHIRALKKAGLIERSGARKNGRWLVKHV